MWQTFLQRQGHTCQVKIVFLCVCVWELRGLLRIFRGIPWFHWFYEHGSQNADRNQGKVSATNFCQNEFWLRENMFPSKIVAENWSWNTINQVFNSFISNRSLLKELRGKSVITWEFGGSSFLYLREEKNATKKMRRYPVVSFYWEKKCSSTSFFKQQCILVSQTVEPFLGKFVLLCPPVNFSLHCCLLSLNSVARFLHSVIFKRGQLFSSTDRQVDNTPRLGLYCYTPRSDPSYGYLWWFSS